MKRILLGLVVCGVLVAVAVIGDNGGTKARLEVAKGAALKKLDGFLGSLDVKRKEVDLAVKSVKEAANEISKQKIKAQVKVDQIDAKADLSLKRFRELIAAGAPGEIEGRTYSLEEIKSMASKVIEAHKGYDSQIAAFEVSQAGLRKIVSNLEKRQNELQGRMTRLEADLTKIDTQMASAKAMKDASAAIGDSEASLNQNVANLEDKVADLMAETQSELVLEGEKWDYASTNREIDSVDAIISKTQEPSDTLSEIDRILAGSK